MEDTSNIDWPLIQNVCPAFARAAILGCQAIGRLDLATELEKVVLPPQIVSGSPASYSFLAYPVPRLTYEQRKLLEVREFERVLVPIGVGLIQLELDVFGKIGWFYVERMPEHFETIVQATQQYVR